VANLPELLEISRRALHAHVAANPPAAIPSPAAEPWVLLWGMSVGQLGHGPGCSAAALIRVIEKLGYKWRAEDTDKVDVKAPGLRLVLGCPRTQCAEMPRLAAKNPTVIFASRAASQWDCMGEYG